MCYFLCLSEYLYIDTRVYNNTAQKTIKKLWRSGPEKRARENFLFMQVGYQ